MRCSSLVSEPRHTSHSHMTADERARIGIPDGFLRLSVGIEDVGDLVADLVQALDACAATTETEWESQARPAVVA